MPLLNIATGIVLVLLGMRSGTQSLTTRVDRKTVMTTRFASETKSRHRISSKLNLRGRHPDILSNKLLTTRIKPSRIGRKDSTPQGRVACLISIRQIGPSLHDILLGDRSACCSMKNSAASQSDSGLPATSSLSASACRHDLWLTAVEALGRIDIGPVAGRFSQAWIAMGVERMQMTDCLSPAYLAIARANLETFIHLVKTEALVQGHPERIDIETLHAAHRQLERKRFLTTFTLWPFLAR